MNEQRATILTPTQAELLVVGSGWLNTGADAVFIRFCDGRAGRVAVALAPALARQVGEQMIERAAELLRLQSAKEHHDDD